MNKRQKELMDRLYEVLNEISIEYQNDYEFKKEFDVLGMFNGDVTDAYNTITIFDTLYNK